MGEEELESLITIDDPGEDDLDEDTFHENTSQPFTPRRPDQLTDVIVDNDGSKVAGQQGLAGEFKSVKFAG